MPRPRQHLKQRPDGRYACTYHGHFFIAKTEKEALAAREAFKLQEAQGMKKDASSTTVREYASEWLPIHKGDVSRKCYNDYAKQLDVLLETIGDMLMMDVKPSDVKRVWLHYSGYSSSTIKRTRQLFFSMFDTACDDGYIRTNPMKSKHAKPPEGTRGTHRAITK